MTSARTRRVRRLPRLLWAVGIACAWPGAAHAGKNDLQLLNLCPPARRAPERWRHPAGVHLGAARRRWGSSPAVAPDADGQSRYRSLMSELGVVVAPRLMTPADTLGYAGFQFSAELGVTKISNNQRVLGRRRGRQTRRTRTPLARMPT